MAEANNPPPLIWAKLCSLCRNSACSKVNTPLPSGTLHRHTQSWDVVWLLRGACWLVRALRAALHESHESAPRCAALLADTGQQHSTTQGA